MFFDDDRNHVVTLNVGGTLFVTSRDTLVNRNAYFANDLYAFSKYCTRLNDKDGNWFVDRDPSFFNFILNYLRDGERVVLPEDRFKLRAIRREAEFYRADGLVRLCDSLLV